MENWVKHLIAYRFDKDHVLRANLLSEGIDSIDVLKTPIHKLENTSEHHIVNIVANYSRLLARAGHKYTWKDVLYTIDVNLPKPRGHIPVQMWSPKDIYDYIEFRVSIDFPGELYPFHIMEATIKELIINAEEHYRVNP